MGRLAVMSNFSEPDRAFGEDTLNMFPRLREPFRVISRTQALAASFDGLQGIFFVDQVAPEPKLREKLIAFVKGGGTLFVRSTWPNPEGSPMQLSSEEDYLYFNLRQLGKGRLAVAKEENPDTYFTCMDVQNIMSHRGDPARLYNGASMNYFYQVSPQGRQGVIHVLNYSRLPGSAERADFFEIALSVSQFCESGNRRAGGAQVVPANFGIRDRRGGTFSAAHFRVWRGSNGDLKIKGNDHEKIF